MQWTEISKIMWFFRSGVGLLCSPSFKPNYHKHSPHINCFLFMTPTYTSWYHSPHFWHLMQSSYCTDATEQSFKLQHPQSVFTSLSQQATNWTVILITWNSTWLLVSTRLRSGFLFRFQSPFSQCHFITWARNQVSCILPLSKFLHTLLSFRSEDDGCSWVIMDSPATY